MLRAGPELGERSPIKIDLSRPILVHLSHQRLHLRLLGLRPKRTQHNPQFFGVDDARPILVEEIE